MCKKRHPHAVGLLRGGGIVVFKLGLLSGWHIVLWPATGWVVPAPATSLRSAPLPARLQHAAQAVSVDVIGVDALLHGLRLPVGALASDLHVRQTKTVDIAEIVAVGLRYHQHPLVDVQPGIVDHVVAENHLGLVDARLYGGRLAVEVGVAVGVVLDDDLGPDTDI